MPKQKTRFLESLNACAIVISALISVTAFAQPEPESFITVEADGLKSAKFAYSDLCNLKQAEVSAKDHDGQTRKYKGVPLVDILESVGVPLGTQLRGKNLLKYVVVAAADSYEVVFSLPEIDPEFTSQIILIAYKVDGENLPKGDGPFRMVVPDDRKHARWVREVTSIKVLTVKK